MATQRSTQAITAHDRDLRHQIRSLQTAAQNNKEDLVRVGNDNLQNFLQQAEHLLSQSFGVEMTKNLINGTQEVQPGSFIHRCKTLYASEHEPMSWHRMATANWAHIPSVSGVECMLGPLATFPKPPKAAARRAAAPRPAVAAVVRPDELQVEHVSEQERQDTDRHIEALWRVVNHLDRQGRPIHVIPLVLCHDSFSQTIENLFALSFLVRDGRVRFVKTPAGLRVVPVTKQQRGEGTAHLERRQAVMAVSMADWQRMQRAVPRSACLLPTRRNVAASAHGPEADAAAGGGEGGDCGASGATRQSEARVPSTKSKRKRTVLGSTENVLQEATPRRRGSVL